MTVKSLQLVVHVVAYELVDCLGRTPQGPDLYLIILGSGLRNLSASPGRAHRCYSQI